MAIVMDTTRTNSKAISHKYDWTSSVLCLCHVTKNLGCVFSTWIALWGCVWLIHTGLQSENNETVSPQTALKVILSRPQPNAVTVQTCMCKMKYFRLLAVHGPSIAQSAWKQFRFLPHRLSWKGTLTEYSTLKNQSCIRYVNWDMKLYWPCLVMGDMIWLSAVQPFQATPWTFGTVESHTQSSSVHVNWHNITQLEYRVQYGLLEWDLYLIQDIWLYRQQKIHTVNNICVKPESDLELIWVMTSPFQRNCYKITKLWNMGRPQKISSVKTHWVNRYMQWFLTFRKWI
jgi:hypothetical protein